MTLFTKNSPILPTCIAASSRQQWLDLLWQRLSSQCGQLVQQVIKLVSSIAIKQCNKTLHRRLVMIKIVIINYLVNS